MFLANQVYRTKDSQDSKDSTRGHFRILKPNKFETISSSEDVWPLEQRGRILIIVISVTKETLNRSSNENAFL